MPDIRYVCLSDMHLGAETSLLTNLEDGSDIIDASKPSPVLEKLVDCLKDLISKNEDKSKKPILVLNGDILELALAEDQDAAMTFGRFINLIMDEGKELFDQIIYNPGNHDHHLWESARETQYAEYISSIPWDEDLPFPWHATNIFTGPVPSYFLTRLVRRRDNLKKMTVQTAYPNFGVLSSDKTKCAIFHHGHFVESVYLLMSTLKTMIFPGSEIPEDIWDIETENFAWIDFFWSTLGRSGAVGKGVGRVYEKLQDPQQVAKLLTNLAAGLAKRYDLSGLGDLIESKLLKWVLDKIVKGVGGLERNKPETLLSDDAQKGLWTYMEKPLWLQLTAEWKRITGKTDLSGFPEIAFVFGHTHKPYQEKANFPVFPGWVNVYNSGGWVVDSVDRQVLHGGAVILLDENLEATSLRMYNETNDPGKYSVSVQEAGHPGDPPGAFHSRIDGLVSPSSDPWKAFADTTAREVNVRAQNLRARINSPSYQ